MQLFIGLTFRQNHLQFKKIDSFRKRFDGKYNRSHILQMTLMPPFKLEGNTTDGLHQFFEEVIEDVDSQLLGMEHSLSVDFNGFDFITGRKGILFLKPTIPIDIFHCQESLKESIKSFGGTFSKTKNLAKSFSNDLQTFLPIGRFTDMGLLSLAVDKARIEFSHPFKLVARDIVLFEKTPVQWLPLKILHRFPLEETKHVIVDNDFSMTKSPVNL